MTDRPMNASRLKFTVKTSSPADYVSGIKSTHRAMQSAAAAGFLAFKHLAAFRDLTLVIFVGSPTKDGYAANDDDDNPHTHTHINNNRVFLA